MARDDSKWVPPISLHQERIIKMADGELTSVQITPDGVSARNYAFDVTPARLVTGLITERGISPATEEGLLGLYPEKSP